VDRFYDHVTTKFHENTFRESRVVTSWWPDRRTDMT